MKLVRAIIFMLFGIFLLPINLVLLIYNLIMALIIEDHWEEWRFKNKRRKYCVVNFVKYGSDLKSWEIEF